MINYIDVIQFIDPGLEVSCRGDTSNYHNLIWSADPISKKELDDYALDYAKFLKIEELSLEAKTRIEVGFVSNALGYNRIYDGKIEDQLNIAGATVATEFAGIFPFPSRDPETKIKEYINHTFPQMQKVTLDGSLFKLNILKKFTELKYYIEQLDHNLTFDEIMEITFDMTIPT